ncbi:MAG: PTS sugar transporter subunit IIA [Planctomycetota bacterium]
MSPERTNPGPRRTNGGAGLRRDGAASAAQAGDNNRHGRHARSPARGREQEPESLRLTELIREGLVRLPLRATDQWGAVDELIKLMVSRREVPSGLASAAKAAVREREAIRPTGWKYGLALPNGRVPGLKRIVAAIGVSPGGVDFACRDGLPARIIVLVLLPEACYSRFAPGIDVLTETFEAPGLREAILAAKTPGKVVVAVEDAESRELA